MRTRDKILQIVHESLLKSWPSVITQELRPYCQKRKSLSTDKRCVYYGDRVVIPFCLRERMLGLLHENHSGIVNMKRLARSYVWWPLCDADVENKIKSCKVCDQTLQVRKEIVTSNWPMTTYSFQRVHVDYFYFKSKLFFIWVDSYSKFCDIKTINSTNVSSLLTVFRKMFALYGLPDKIVSDNGPPFNSYVFKKFCQCHGIELVHPPPPPRLEWVGRAHGTKCKKSVKTFLLRKWK